MEPIPEKHQAENAKRVADKDFEAGKISGAKYERAIQRANKVRKRK